MSVSKNPKPRVQSPPTQEPQAIATPGANVLSELKVGNLRKAYHGRQVVHDVSLSVNSSEVVGLLGPNGAGKTTCFYMIVGLVPCDDGTIQLDDTPLGSMPIHQRARMGLSYLPQEASVFRKLTVEENIQAVLELQVDERGKSLRKAAVKERLESLLAELQIEHIRSNTALSLSGGERRRVEIARALANSPRFVLLDEPFAGVDPIAVLEIQRIVKFLKDRGIGVLITDHNVRETLGICDRAYIIRAGTVLASGTPDDVVKNDDVRRYYLGENFSM
jgi:lipopolysaccharide export system ATP-binding protein